MPNDIWANPILWATIGTLFGGSGLAVITKWLNRGKDQQDFAGKIRDELRVDIKRYQDEVAGYKEETHKLRIEVDEWRKKYFDLEVTNGKIIRHLQREVDVLKDVLHDNGIDLNGIDMPREE